MNLKGVNLASFTRYLFLRMISPWFKYRIHTTWKYLFLRNKKHHANHFLVDQKTFRSTVDCRVTNLGSTSDHSKFLLELSIARTRKIHKNSTKNTIWDQLANLKKEGI